MKFISLNNASLYVKANGEVVLNGSLYDLNLLILYAIDNIINGKELEKFNIKTKKRYVELMANSIKDLIHIK